MTETEIVEEPTIERELEIEEATRIKLLNQVQEESQVIIHCSYTSSSWCDRIRIWKSTFLYAKNSSHRSELVHIENISMYPTWTDITLDETLNFTLVFTGLPEHCKHFDMIENIPEPGGFEFKNIERNNSDVYYLDMTTFPF